MGQRPSVVTLLDRLQNSIELLFSGLPAWTMFSGPNLPRTCWTIAVKFSTLEIIEHTHGDVSRQPRIRVGRVDRKIQYTIQRHPTLLCDILDLQSRCV